MSIDRQALTQIAFTRLQSVDTCHAILGEPDTAIPTLPGSDQHVEPYAILWPGAGRPVDEISLQDANTDLDWLIQITCAAGYIDDLQALITRVDTVFNRWQPATTGDLVFGRFKPPIGDDPGPIRFDRDVDPHRPFLPLQYRCPITAS